MATDPLHLKHERLFQQNRFVYPVLSRRSGGVSIGVNLNPDKICNFDCIYCQVDRIQQSETRFVEVEQLYHELHEMLELAASGELYQAPKFRETPPELRRLNDIAFSGDGEPTTYRNFDDLVRRAAEIENDLKLDAVKMILITNASQFHRPHVERGLLTLDGNNGEIWAKLDAGTEAYFRLVERTSIPFTQILRNIGQAARVRPLVIQSLFMRINDEPPRRHELLAFCDRLNEMRESGGAFRLVQIYTVARPPAESYVTPLRRDEVDAIVELTKQQTGLPVLGYYGSEN